MFYMCINLFHYIMFISVMVMPCDIISYITCIDVLVSKVIIISNVQSIISFTYIVCVISVNGIMFIIAISLIIL